MQRTDIDEIINFQHIAKNIKPNPGGNFFG